MERMILVTGGAGYIGSHAVVKLTEAGFPVVVLDNFSNSDREVMRRLSMLTGKRIELIEADIRDRAALRNAFKTYSLAAVMHFAGLKAVAESEAVPLKYYDENVCGSLVLFDEMLRARVHNMVFSSSATVYGYPGYSQLNEDTPLEPVNVYGRTKLVIENMLRDIHRAYPCWRIALLRYFNPIGAHVSGMIGEDPLGPPGNLMPYIAQVAARKRPELRVFGGDYPTPDGTCRRDYIHVDDLATGHLAALNALLREESCLITVNLGTGRAYSVLEMVDAFQRATGTTVPYQIVARRAGDLPEYYADPRKASRVLGWEARLGIERMCMDAWRWQLHKTNGHRS